MGQLMSTPGMSVPGRQEYLNARAFGAARPVKNWTAGRDSYIRIGFSESFLAGFGMDVPGYGQRRFAAMIIG